MEIHAAEFVTSVGHPSQIPADGLPEVAFVGRSNVGKSSLLNALLNRKNLAKTSNTPGKTRTLNYYRVNSALYLVDFPGYGYARRTYAEQKQWAGIIDDYLNNQATLRGIVHLLDARHDPTAQDLEMIRWMQFARKPFLAVLTKVDKLSGSQLKPRLDRTGAVLREFEDLRFLPFSAKSGRGRKELWKWIQGVV